MSLDISSKPSQWPTLASVSFRVEMRNISFIIIEALITAVIMSRIYHHVPKLYGNKHPMFDYTVNS